MKIDLTNDEIYFIQLLLNYNDMHKLILMNEKNQKIAYEALRRKLN